MSLAADKVIKIWDLRNHRCVQTITEHEWHTIEDVRPATIMYDTYRHRLVTAVHRPAVWPHMCVGVFSGFY